MADRVLVIRPQARDDVIDTAAQIAKDEPRSAERFVAAVAREFDVLVLFPRIGRARRFASSRLRGLRSRPVSGFESWLVFYAVRRSSIEIVRVLHGARDLPRVLRR